MDVVKLKFKIALNLLEFYISKRSFSRLFKLFNYYV